MSEAINAGVAAAGFTDLRPAHGFVFARVAAGGMTTGQAAVVDASAVDAAVGKSPGVGAASGGATAGDASAVGSASGVVTAVGAARVGVTAGDIAVHLGVTKQAAAQLVEELVRKGYLVRLRHPRDARAQLLSLTDHGWAATRAAEQAADRISHHWAAILGTDRLLQLAGDLADVAEPGPMRPTW